MSSLNQLISEIAHSVQQADSVPVRRAIRQGIIHARNELIRHSFSNHNYTDKVLKQRFKLSIKDVPDGDLNGIPNDNIKRTVNKVPRPVRMPINLPFHSVKTIGVINPTVIAFVGEASAKFYKSLPGMTNTPTYDYINDYIYFNGLSDDIEYIIVESVFEYPHEIKIDTSDKAETEIVISDDDEFFLPEDLVNSVKKLVLETFNNQIIRDTNEIPTPNLVK